MIDIHSHLIFGVDNGPASLEESMRMVQEAEKHGIKVIICTPHVRDYGISMESIYKNFSLLCEKTADYDVTLKLGFEARLDPDLYMLIDQGQCLTLNGSSYMLLEFPNGVMPLYSREAIYNLQIRSIKPIIAHPERCAYFLRSMRYLEKYVELGCLVQLDAASIAGANGWKAKRFSRRIIKNNLAHFIASDSHKAEDYAKYFSKACRLAIRWAGQNYSDCLFYRNPKNVLDNLRKVKGKEVFLS